MCLLTFSGSLFSIVLKVIAWLLGIRWGSEFRVASSRDPRDPQDPRPCVRQRQPKATCDVEDVDTIFVRKTLNGLEKEDHIIKLASNFCLVMLTPLFHEKEDLGIPWSCGRHIVLVV